MAKVKQKGITKVCYGVGVPKPVSLRRRWKLHASQPAEAYAIVSAGLKASRVAIAAIRSHEADKRPSPQPELDPA